MSRQKLTSRQKKFVDLYEGNATKAAIKAGYSKRTAYSIGQENLKKPEVIKALQEREKKETGPLIADRIERQQFWTSVLRGKIGKVRKVKMNDRLKASELLGKSEADFTEKVSHEGLNNLAEELKAARLRSGQTQPCQTSRSTKNK
ncbi:MAG: terminase small subunit [Candidatus Omnitrophica bacterium]|nr:terminase small subunit [Candidatus Omnitrophota bacterium]